VFSIVGLPTDVEDVLLGDNGAISVSTVVSASFPSVTAKLFIGACLSEHVCGGCRG